jgi:pyrimidine deaminase RibD-like protein
MVIDNSFFMNLALKEAWKFQGLTYPNPAVGCCVIGEKFELLAINAHQKAGQPHAEVNALKDAYKNWIKLREKSRDIDNERLCYCGHTDKCSCSDPDILTFIDSVKRGAIILGDKNNGWKRKGCHKGFSGTYKNNKFEIGIEVHSRPGEGDVVAELINSKKLRVECKKGTIEQSKSSSEYSLLREAIGQLITTKEVNANDVFAACVPASKKNHNLSKTWKASPLIIKAGIHLLTIDRDGNCEEFENIVSDNT